MATHNRLIFDPFCDIFALPHKYDPKSYSMDISFAFTRIATKPPHGMPLALFRCDVTVE